MKQNNSFALRPIHVGISVYDMDESVRWYQENLGFDFLRDDGYIKPLEARICFLERDGFEIELFQYKDPKPMPDERRNPNTDLQTVGTKHIAFEVTDLSALKAGFIRNGVEIAHEAVMRNEKVLFLRDCNGVLIELIQPAESI